MWHQTTDDERRIPTSALLWYHLILHFIYSLLVLSSEDACDTVYCGMDSEVRRTRLRLYGPYPCISSYGGCLDLHYPPCFSFDTCRCRWNYCFIWANAESILNRSTSLQNTINQPTTRMWLGILQYLSHFNIFSAALDSSKVPQSPENPHHKARSVPTPIERLLSWQSFTIDRNTLAHNMAG